MILGLNDMLKTLKAYLKLIYRIVNEKQQAELDMNKMVAGECFATALYTKLEKIDVTLDNYTKWQRKD